METIEKLKKKLSKQMSQEYKEYISQLKKLSIDEIIKKSYETTIKKQFLSLLGTDQNIDRNELKALLHSDNILDELYEQWNYDIRDFNVVLEDSFIYSFNEFVKNYEEDAEIYIEVDEKRELIQMITDVLNEADRYDCCEKLKERYNVSQIDTFLIDEVLRDKQELEYLNDFLIDIKDNEQIQYLCESITFNNEYYNNIAEKILPQLKEINKELKRNKPQKNKEMER